MDINFIDSGYIAEEVAQDEQVVAPEVELAVARQHHEARAEEVVSRFNFRRIVRWIIYVTAAVIPLLALPWTSELLDFNKQTFLVVAAGLGLVAFLVDIVQSGVVRIRVSSLYLPLGALSIASFAAAIFSKSAFQSFIGLGESSLSFAFITFFSLTILSVLAINTIEDGGDVLTKILGSSIATALGLAIVQLFGTSVLNFVGLSAVTANTIGSVNMIGVVAAIFLPVYLAGRFRVARYIDLFKIYAVIALFWIVVINWWLVWTIAFIALFAWIILKVQEDRRLSLRAYALPLLVIVVGSFLLLVKFSMPVLKAKLPPEVVPSYGASLSIARDVLLESPITGYGQGNFDLAYDRYRPKAISSTIFANTRFSQGVSSIVTLVTEGGAIVLFAVVFLLAFAGKLLYRSRSSADYVVAAGITTLLLFSSNITFLLVFFLSLALLELHNPNPEERIIELEESPRYSLISSGAFVLGLVAVLAGGYFTTIRYISDIQYTRAATQTDPEQARVLASSAISISGSDPRPYQLLAQALLVQARDQLNKKDPKISQEERNKKIASLTASAVDAVVRATTIDPYHATTWFNRGIVYQNLIGLADSADQAAIAAFEQALKLSPNDPTIYYQIGLISLSVAENNRLVVQSLSPEQRAKVDPAQVKKLIDDNFARAEENYKKAIALNNNFGQAVYDLGVVYERQGKLGQAVKQFETIRTANPRDAGLAFTLGLLYYRNNQKDLAVKQWQDAVSLFPNYSNAHWYLSLSYEEQGRVDQAITELEKIQQFNPDSKEVAQRLETLRSGKRVIPPGKVLNQRPL